jgi:hypothetical protein
MRMTGSTCRQYRAALNAEPIVPCPEACKRNRLVVWQEDVPRISTSVLGQNKSWSKSHAKVEPSLNIMRLSGLLLGAEAI